MQDDGDGDKELEYDGKDEADIKTEHNYDGLGHEHLDGCEDCDSGHLS